MRAPLVDIVNDIVSSCDPTCMIYSLIFSQSCARAPAEQFVPEHYDPYGQLLEDSADCNGLAASRDNKVSSTSPTFLSVYLLPTKGHVHYPTSMPSLN
jgi:hypothetical protein